MTSGRLRLGRRGPRPSLKFNQAHKSVCVCVWFSTAFGIFSFWYRIPEWHKRGRPFYEPARKKSLNCLSVFSTTIRQIVAGWHDRCASRMVAEPFFRGASLDDQTQSGRRKVKPQQRCFELLNLVFICGFRRRRTMGFPLMGRLPFGSNHNWFFVVSSHW